MFFLLMLAFIFHINCYSESLVVNHTQTQKVGMRIAYLGNTAECLAATIKNDMSFSGHYTVDVHEYRTVPHKKSEITALMREGILFLLIIESHAKIVTYRLYDTTTGELVAPVSGKCVVEHIYDSRYGHHIADQLWRMLMGSPSIFKTRLAYAKEVPYKKRGIAVKYICTADYNGNNEQVMVSQSTVSIAPRWSGTQEAPLIFYSEYTKTNVQLMAVDARKKRIIVSSRDGETMHLTSNKDRSRQAFSASHGTGNTHIYCIHNNKKLTQCTFGDVSDGSPTFSSDGSKLYYCSDVQTGIPHIMVYDFATQKHSSVPIKGYCVSPAHNPILPLIAYSKMIGGWMQICVFDIVTAQEKQITLDSAHHEDPTWSPEGNFLAYTHRVGTASRIRTHCYATGHEQYATPAGINCSYPAWSIW